MTFGEKLKQLRESKYMTTKDLSVKSGLSIVIINKYENGHSKPTPISVHKLADALECAYEDLFECTRKK